MEFLGPELEMMSEFSAQNVRTGTNACHDRRTQLQADVLPQNKAMLAVFARSGLPMRKTLEEGAVHVTLSLTVDAQSTMSQAIPR